MSTNRTSDSALDRWYRDRIAEPSTEDEARGYWIFAIGVTAGVLGILAFLASGSATGLREASIVLAAAGLVLLMAGPVIRLPLERRATLLTYLGAAISGLAIVWFVVAFPGNWSTAGGQPTIIALYAAGLVVIAVGGILVPLLTGSPDIEEELRSLQGELDGLREALADTEADEADLAGMVAELRTAIAGSEADGAGMRTAFDELSAALADTEADEADLAAELRALRTSQSRFEIYEDRGGEWRWRLRHRNGNVTATSGEGYTRRHNAQKGMQSVRRNALGATVLVFEEEELPEEGETFEPFREAESRADFELYEDEAGEFRWRLHHRNGNVIADGSEGYVSRSNVRRAVRNVRGYVGPADYLRIDPAAFEVYRDRAGEFRWRLVHRNGNILADGGEGYTRRNDARRAVDRVRERADELEFEVYEDRAGEHRWRVRSGNDIIADSGEGYTSRSDADDAVERVREHAPEADVLDVGRAAFEIYEDRGGEWRWRLRHRNGNVLADSGQGYSDRSGARDGVESVKRNAPNAGDEESDG